MLNIIGNCNRKFPEKSRSVFVFFGNMPGVKSRVSRIDIFFLLIAAVAALVFFIPRISGVLSGARQTITVIGVSPQFEYFFGEELAASFFQEFEELHPEMRLVTASWENADVLFFDDAGFAVLVAAGENGAVEDAAEGDAESGAGSSVVPALAPLSPFIQDEAGEERLTITLVRFMDIFLYNIDILQEAGLVRPPRTRAEFLSAARAVAALGRNGVYGFALALSREDPLAVRREVYPWVWADGANTAAATANLALSGTAANVIALFGQLDNEGILPSGTFEKNRAQRIEEFAAGGIAMMAASARDIPFLQEAADFRFDITVFPSSVFGGRRIGLTGIYAGISGGSMLQNEAWAFLEFIKGKRQELAASLHAVPGIFPDVIGGNFSTEDPLLQKAWEIFEAFDAIEYLPGCPEQEEIRRMIWERLAGVISGR